MTLKLANKVVECLKQNPGKKYTAHEIAEWIFKTYPAECRKKQSVSTATVTPLNSDKALLKQLVKEIYARRPERITRKIKTIEERPRKYYYTEDTDEVEIVKAESIQDDSTAVSERSSTKEHDLYPLLSAYLQSELEIYSMRIDEKRSKNSSGSGGNKWLHPDLVGMENPSENWNSKVKDCAKKHFDNKVKLWSFEVKILINRTNVRGAFFQAVSNSAWANWGYLVASELQGVDTFKELSILSRLHGVGFIHLDANDPAKSQIMLSAKERPEIDWDTVNRLVEENEDFSNYIEYIHDFHLTGKVRTANWETKFT